MGIFDKLFDFNHDGHADAFETAMGFMMMDDMERSGSPRANADPELDDPTLDDPTLSVDLFGGDDDELVAATGYDRDDLEWISNTNRLKRQIEAFLQPAFPCYGLIRNKLLFVAL